MCFLPHHCGATIDISRREHLLLSDIRCKYEDKDSGYCGKYINVEETGLCKCNDSHFCYAHVLDVINKIS